MNITRVKFYYIKENKREYKEFSQTGREYNSASGAP